LSTSDPLHDYSTQFQLWDGKTLLETSLDLGHLQQKAEDRAQDLLRLQSSMKDPRMVWSLPFKGATTLSLCIEHGWGANVKHDVTQFAVYRVQNRRIDPPQEPVPHTDEASVDA
jgi:hypothetical protein